MSHRVLAQLLSIGVAVTATTILPSMPSAAVGSDNPDTVLVTSAFDGTALDAFSDRPQISGNGRYVIFDSFASNVLPNFPSRTDVRRVYRKDMETGGVQLVSAITGTDERPKDPEPLFSSFGYLDDSGDLAAFVSDAVGLAKPKIATQRSVYVRDMTTKVTELISQNSAGTPFNAAASRPMISGNGRYVAFSSKATNGGSTVANVEQTYLRDRVAKTTRLVSVAPDGATPGNAQSYRGMVSDDARYYAWAAKANNLTAAGGPPGMEAIYTRDLQTGITTRVTIRLNGQPGAGSRPYMTPDGRFVAFNSYDIYTAGDVPETSDTFVWDRTTGTISTLTATDSGDADPGDSLRLFLSDDGNLATWNSFNNQLVTNDKNPGGDVFYRDRSTGVTTLLSLSYYGGPASGRSFRPVFSNDGQALAYQSQARNLVAGDPSLGSLDQIYYMHPSTVVGPGLDVTKPSVLGSSPAAGSTIVGSEAVRFSGTVTDDRAVDEVFLQIRDNNKMTWLQGDGSWGTAAARLTTTLTNRYETSSEWSHIRSLPAGKYGYRVVARDPALNTTTSALISFTVTTAPPPP